MSSSKPPRTSTTHRETSPGKKQDSTFDRGRGRLLANMQANSNQGANTVYVIDSRHYLDDKGDIGPAKGPVRKMADFITSVIAHASDFDRPESTPGPVCFKCRKRDNHRVDTGMTDDDVVAWYCPACRTEGLISNWQGTFWDISHGMPSD